MRIIDAWKRRRLVKAISKGEISINDARRKLGLPPYDHIANLDGAIAWADSAHPEP